MKAQAEEKLISVIVAACNIGTYLPRCLDSILAQSYQNLEIIVVDDGSSDDTGAVCDRYAAREERVTAIHQHNQGPSGARNSALCVAKGDYIGFVDGDDWIEPDMYREMLRACEEKRADVAVCSFRHIGDGKEDGVFSGEQYVLNQEEALEVYICDNRSFHIYHSVWSKLFRRDVVRDIRFPDGRKSEDIIYTTQAFLRINTCVFLDTPYYNYWTDRKGSIMNERLRERRFQDEIPFWKEQIRYLKEADFVELSEKAAHQFYRKMVFYYVDFRNRRMKEAGRELIGLLRGEREKIDEVYGKAFVPAGDRVRMRLALFWPELYYLLVLVYDRFIIPLRQ